MGRGGGWGGRWQKLPGEDTGHQSPQMVLTTQLDRRDTIPVEGKFQAGYTQLAHSTGANVSVMVLQGCKSTPQKSRPIESGHGRHAVQVANVCSYKLG